MGAFFLPQQYSRRICIVLISLFMLIQGGLLIRAVLPLPERAPWPWRMFDRRGPWERRLEATGYRPDQSALPIPLEAFFTYQRGFTPLRVYDQLSGLAHTPRKATQQGFADHLAWRMLERGETLLEVELTWRRVHLDSGQVVYQRIGRFKVSPRAFGAPRR